MRRSAEESLQGDGRLLHQLETLRQIADRAIVSSKSHSLNRNTSVRDGECCVFDSWHSGQLSDAGRWLRVGTDENLLHGESETFGERLSGYSCNATIPQRSGLSV